MKKIILFALVMCIGLVSLSQDYKHIFLGKDAYICKGLYLKYENSISPMYSFYKEKPKSATETPVYEPTKQYNFITDTAKLTNREFLVINVELFSSRIESQNYSDTFVFELNDGKETIYFIYDGFSFPFLVKGFNPKKITYTKENINKFIEKEVNDFGGEITYRSPLLNDLSIIKIVRNNTQIYFLSLSTIGSTLNYGTSGVIILFEDGTKWSKPNEEVDVKYKQGDDWEYSAFIRLTKGDLSLFSTKKIRKFRLYIYDNNNPKDKEIFPLYVQSIMEMN